MTDDAPDSEPVTFLHRPIPAWMQRRVVEVAPGAVRPYDEAEWLGALIVVEQGAVALECVRGGRRRFETGAVLWLAGIPLRAIHNEGTETAVLVAVSRSNSPPADEFSPEPRSQLSVGP